MGVPIQIRVYDNEISVWNDGGLPEGITEVDLKKYTGLNREIL
jgi:ATP-dependent DNA helicase RecG